MGKVSLAEIVEMPIEDRIQLVEDVWDSIAAVPEAVPLTDAQRVELDRRLEAYHKNPAAGAPWEEVKAKVLMGASTRIALSSQKRE